MSVHNTILFVIAIVGLIASLSVLYCFGLLIVAVISRLSCKVDVATGDGPPTRFRIVIPAHNEELVIAATLERVGKLDYPAASFSTVVVADNCTDATVEIAGSYENVTVYERRDPDNPGKPSALNWALAKLTKAEDFDAIIIVDADTHMDASFLIAMDRAYRSAGKPPMFAAQGWYAVLNPDETWRTSLMAGALGLVHLVRPAARELLKLSVGLKGNGMCFSRNVVEQLPWRSDSLTEDIELGLDLIQRFSGRVRFVEDAVVRAQMPTTESASASQRKRWEQGRSEIVKRRALPLLAFGVAKFNRVAIDAALDLIVPPLAEIGALLAAWGVLTAIGWALGVHIVALAAWWGAACLLFALYVVGGFAVAGVSPSAYRALALAPFYIFWKIATVVPGMIKKRSEFKWVRTERTAIATEEPTASLATDSDTKPVTVVTK